jgi:putative salt-induced outer membrane protein YdiY
MKLILTIAFVCFIYPVSAHADVVMTTDGSRLTGKVLGIEKGIIKLETAYAGTIGISQENVTSFSTEEAVLLRFAGGETLAGKPEAAGEEGLRIQSGDDFRNVAMQSVERVWPLSGEDPEIVLERVSKESTRRKWLFSGGFDLLGKQGNSEDFSIGGNFEAKLKGEHDELLLSAEYENREKNGDKTADRSGGGVSYEVFRRDAIGWYLRSEIEMNAITAVDLRSTSATGLSYRWINKEDHTLVARLGPGYRYTGYESNKEDESSMTLDLGLAHYYRVNDFFSIKTDITYVPALGGSGNDRLVQDSGLVFPLAGNRKWKVRMGIRNEFESEPAVRENLDTTYYTRIIYSWD